MKKIFIVTLLFSIGCYLGVSEEPIGRYNRSLKMESSSIDCYKIIENLSEDEYEIRYNKDLREFELYIDGDFICSFSDIDMEEIEKDPYKKYSSKTYYSKDYDKGLVKDPNPEPITQTKNSKHRSSPRFFPDPNPEPIIK